MKKKFLIPLVVVAVIFAFGIGYKVKAASVTMKISDFVWQVVAKLKTSANITIKNEAGLKTELNSIINSFGAIDLTKLTEINCSEQGLIGWVCGGMMTGSSTLLQACRLAGDYQITNGKCTTKPD